MTGRSNFTFTVITATVIALALNGLNVATAAPPPGFDVNRDAWPTAVGPASCRPGDRIETGVQCEVPPEDRDAGRSTLGYNCNIDLVGQHQGATLV
jgi:hypothetical protein